MISFDMYKKSLTSKGNNVAQIRKNQSDDIMNATFTNDVAYKKVYILDSDGWHFEDAKYQKHSAYSILKDEVDYYLQFRPKTHYEVGTYVIIPDDTSFDVDVPLDNPFNQPVNERTQWWLIVGRDNSGQFVRYNILRCNWNFQWIYKGKIQNCFGCVRNANSYTAGSWVSEYTTSLDNITSAWLPDVFSTYNDHYKELGLDDIRTIDYEYRFMISDNIIHPKVYKVTKVVELVPKGVVKLTLKQHEFDETRDNSALRICNYYDDNGKPLIETNAPIEPDVEKTSEIKWMDINYDGELDYIEDSTDMKLHLGKISYFGALFSSVETIALWNIDIVDEDNSMSDEDKAYYIGLLKIDETKDVGDNTISIKPGKANSLKGKKFILSVSDEEGYYSSSVELEVE